MHDAAHKTVDLKSEIPHINRGGGQFHALSPSNQAIPEAMRGCQVAKADKTLDKNIRP
jgi:hypothetical protein